MKWLYYKLYFFFLQIFYTNWPSLIYCTCNGTSFLLSKTGFNSGFKYCMAWETNFTRLSLLALPGDFSPSSSTEFVGSSMQHFFLWWPSETPWFLLTSSQGTPQWRASHKDVLKYKSENVVYLLHDAEEFQKIAVVMSYPLKYNAAGRFTQCIIILPLNLKKLEELVEILNKIKNISTHYSMAQAVSLDCPCKGAVSPRLHAV